MPPTQPDLPRARVAALALMVAVTLCLSACATRPPASDKEATAEYEQNNDPLEPTNRVFYAVNNGLDTVFLKPVATAYRYAVPEAVRHPIGNLVANLGNPVIFANDAFQGRPKLAKDTVLRLLINTTLGVGGLFDVADRFGIKAHDNDFGITMALWGMPSGPFLYLPVLGPSNPRDAVGYGVDIALNPITWPPNGGGFNAFRITETAVAAIGTREQALDITKSIDKTSLDPYATYRSLSQQHRESVIQRMRAGEAVRDTQPLPKPADAVTAPPLPTAPLPSPTGNSAHATP